MIMIKIKSFLNNESENTINDWLARNVNEDSFIDMKVASVVGENGNVRDRVFVVYRAEDDWAEVE